MRSPNASVFRTFNNGKELTTMFKIVVDKLNRYVYLPNRDEFDNWLLSLANQAGRIVIRDHAVRPEDIEFNNK